jgi:type IV pilus assembly protein PilM
MFGLEKILRLKRSQTCVGMQIMDKHIKLIELTINNRGADIEQQQIIPLADGSIRNGKIIDEESVASRLKEAVQQYGLKGALVNLTVPTSNVILRRSVFPSLKDKELRNMIDVELHGGTQIPFKNPIFDFVRLGPPANEQAADKGKGGKPQEEVLIIATPADMVESYSQVVQQAGLVPNSVDLAPLALFRLLLANLRQSGVQLADPFMIVHAETEFADFSIFAEGTPNFIRSLPMNSGFMLDSGHEPNETYGRNLSMELGRVLNYYKYSVASNQQDVKQLFLTGDPELVTPLIEQLGHSFEGTIVSLPMENIRTRDSRYKSFAVPIGLAMKGA